MKIEGSQWISIFVSISLAFLIFKSESAENIDCS